ncbi:MAG TPA: hypothetical protein VF903_07960 [Nitrospirota bacterium]
MRNSKCEARNIRNKIVGLFLLLAVFLPGAGAGDQGSGELAALEERQKSLRSKIEALRDEQDFLLFQKSMYSADSKYLILNIRKNTGQLKYKNRLLKDFHFVPSKNFPAGALKPGMLVLTKKIEDKNKRPALMFGSSFILQGKKRKPSPEQAKLPYISVTKRDMRSLFFAVEEGALAYIVR